MGLVCNSVDFAFLSGTKSVLKFLMNNLLRWKKKMFLEILGWGAIGLKMNNYGTWLNHCTLDYLNVIDITWLLNNQYEISFHISL